LLSRYRDTRRIFLSSNAIIYMTINALASALAYYFLTHYAQNLSIFSSDDDAVKPVEKVLVAGLSAMFVLRSSFFSYKDKDSDKVIEIGLGGIINIFLHNAERKFDQSQSVATLQDIEKIMTDIEFDTMSVDLSAICLSLMENVSADEQKGLAESIDRIKNSQTRIEYTKTLQLGILIARVTGTKLLKAGVDTLKKELAKAKEKVEAGVLPAETIFNTLDLELKKLENEASE
jgi:hypothetical protein